MVQLIQCVTAFETMDKCEGKSLCSARADSSVYGMLGYRQKLAISLRQSTEGHVSTRSDLAGIVPHY